MATIEERKDMEKEFNNQIEELKSSIERVGLRQDEVKCYIVDITAAINEAKLTLKNLPKEEYKIKSTLYLTIQKNSELVAKMYDTIANFESVRHRYQAEIGKITRDKLMFLNIELKKVEDKMDSTTAGMTRFMRELREFVAAANQNPAAGRINVKIEDDPAYSME